MVFHACWGHRGGSERPGRKVPTLPRFPGTWPRASQLGSWARRSLHASQQDGLTGEGLRGLHHTEGTLGEADSGSSRGLSRKQAALRGLEPSRGAGMKQGAGPRGLEILHGLGTEGEAVEFSPPETACPARSLLGRVDPPREGNGYPLQYSCLENSMDRGAWWATVHGVAKSQTWLSD